MNRNWKVLVPALALAMTLTACGGRDTGGTAGNGTAGNGTAGNSVTGNSAAGNDAAGNGAADNGPVSGSVEQNGRAAHRRTAYDYLNDGKYKADDDGQVNGSWDPMGRDFTQGARDLVRDAGDAIGDMGRDVGRTVGDMGRNVRNAVRNMPEE